MGRVYEKWHICKCLVFHAENLVKVYTQKNSGYTKSRRKIRQQKIPKINSKFLHIEVLSREAWASKDTRFLTLSRYEPTDAPKVLSTLQFIEDGLNVCILGPSDSGKTFLAKSLGVAEYSVAPGSSAIIRFPCFSYILI